MLDEVCDWRVNAYESPHRTCRSTSDPHPISAQVNFLVRQTPVPNEDKEEHRNLFRTRMFTFGGTQGGPLYFKLRSYLNLHELSRVDAH